MTTSEGIMLPGSDWLSQPEPNVFIGAGIIALFITFFGWYMAYRIRRPLLFRVKLASVYILPLMLAGTYLCPYLNFSHTYRMLLLYAFIIMQSMLYWREVRKMTTSIGYHKSVLVNFLDMVPDLVWMKGIDGEFTYTNKAICEMLLKCTPEEAYGKTGVEIAEMHRRNGEDYTFGEVCCDSDAETMAKSTACRFLEFGKVNGKFLALQVFKAPLWVRLPDGSMKIVGTIGMGRDLTYDYEDHENIWGLCKAGELEEAIDAFERHMNRYKYAGGGCSAGIIGEEYAKCV